MEEVRVCKKCGEEKGIDEYRKHKHGHTWVCKQCRREEQNARRTPEYHKAYYENNKERSLASSRNWQNKNKEYVKQKVKIYLAENKEIIAEKRREWCRNNPDGVRIRRNRRRALKLSAKVVGLEYDKEAIKNLYAYQSGRCACCGKELHNIYHLDHIYPLAHGGKDTVLNIQLLCPTCNSIKGSKCPDDFREYLAKFYPERYEYYVVQQHGINEGINFN